MLLPSMFASLIAAAGTSNAQIMSSNSTLAARGAAYAVASDQRGGFEAMFGDAWDEERNPTGLVNLGAAENAAMLDSIAELSQRYNFQLERSTFNLEHGAWGSPRLRKAMANHINKHFNVYHPFNESEITFATGGTALFDLLGFSLFNPGDGILLTRPSYPGFASDFALKAGVKPVFVSFNETDQFIPSSIAYYEEAISSVQNTTVRAMILCNPHNPLGESYPRDTIIEIMKFAYRHNLHLIVDEVYALSTHNTSDQASNTSTPFNSAFSFNSTAYIDQNYLHLLYSTSKDFAAFGLRLGALLTKNRELTLAISNQVTFNWPGNAVQQIGTLLLEDDIGKAGFISESRRVATRNSEFVRAVLDRVGVPFKRTSNAGFFLWVDLSGYLGKGGEWEEENALTKRLFEGGVFLLGGRQQHAERAGFYRLCFSQRENALREGMRRVLRVLGQDDGVVDELWGKLVE